MDFDAIKNFLYGGTGGIVSRTLTAPFERLKMLRQNFPNQYKGINVFRSLHTIYLTEGVHGLFVGNLANCSRVFPQKSMEFGIFNYCNKHVFDDEVVGKKTNYFISGSIAGIVGYTSIYPMETIRSKISVQKMEVKYNGIMDCLMKTIKEQGVRGLYRGCAFQAVGMIPFQGTNFLTYNYLQDLYNSKYNLENDPSKKLYSSPICGSLAGMTAVSLAFPFDTVKRRLQLTGEQGNPHYKGIFDCLRYTYQTYGIKGFYRGLVPCYMKMVPASALCFATVELCKKYF